MVQGDGSEGWGRELRGGGGGGGARGGRLGGALLPKNGGHSGGCQIGAAVFRRIGKLPAPFADGTGPKAPARRPDHRRPKGAGFQAGSYNQRGRPPARTTERSRTMLTSNSRRLSGLPRPGS